MNIKPLLNQQNITINSINQNCNQANFNQNNINFGSKKSKEAVKLLDNAIDNLINGSELNILNKIKFNTLLKEALPEIMGPENYINKGRDSKVYKISDKYVAKIRRGYYAKNSMHTYSPTYMPNKQFKDLDCYYGEPVAKVGKVEILKNATPNENHMYCGTTYHGNGNVTAVEMQRYENEFLPACSEVPQESFDRLASNLKKLNSITKRNLKGKKETYVPDIINPNNLLISNNKFVLVDQLDTVPVENPNSIYTMLEPLILRMNPETHAEAKNELIEIRKNIFKKVLIASEKNDLPLDSPIKYPFCEWILQNLIGIKNDIIPELISMRKNKVPVEKRIQTIQTLLGNKAEEINPDKHINIRA